MQRYQQIIQQPNYGRGATLTAGGGYTATCTSGIPVFADFELSEDCYDAINMIMNNTTDIEQNIAEVNLQGGLFELPAGELRGAVGATYRENELEFRPDHANAVASVVENPIGLFSASATGGYTSVYEAYGEALVPILADLPAVQELNLELGFRYSDYNTAGEVETYKVLGDWSINDFVRVRGGYQLANRAPNIAELFQPPTLEVVGFGPSDPCTILTLAPWGNVPSNPDRAQVQQLCSDLIDPNTDTSNFDLDPDNFTGPGSRGFFPLELAVNQGNSDLLNEEAETLTLGVVLSSPFNNPFLADLSGTIDWYQIEIADAIQPLDSLTAYEQCFNANGVSNPSYDYQNEFCQLITREPVSGGRFLVDTPYSNLGAIHTAGVDIQVNWGMDLADAGFGDPGRVFATAVLNVLDKFETQDEPGGEFTDAKGTLDQGGQFDYRLFADFGYARGPATLGLRWRNLPDVENAIATSQPDTTVEGAGDYNIFDVYGRYDLSETVTFRAGVDNLFDRDPEIVGRNLDPDNFTLASGQTNPGFYDVLGRRFFVGVQLNY